MQKWWGERLSQYQVVKDEILKKREAVVEEMLEKLLENNREALEEIRDARKDYNEMA